MTHKHPFWRQLWGNERRDLKLLIRWPRAALTLLPLLLLWGATLLSDAGWWHILPDDDTRAACSLTEKPEGNRLEGYLYKKLMNHPFSQGPADGTSSKDEINVTRVTISESTLPGGILTNVCEARRVVAQLIKRLTLLTQGRPKVIAVDMSYSESSCPDGNDGGANSELRDAVQKAGLPIVVGLATHKRENGEGQDDCLVRSAPFDFLKGSDTPGTTIVQFGLVRLNNDLLKIPLGWWIFNSDTAATDAPGDALGRDEASLDKNALEHYGKLEKGFALVTAEAFDDGVFNRLREGGRELKLDEHPYTSFVNAIPEAKAEDALCHLPRFSAKDLIPAKCDYPESDYLKDLSGRIVVIGEHTSTDIKRVAGRDMDGLDVQANYIDALLRQRFVRESRLLDYMLVLSFVFVAMLSQGFYARDFFGEWGAYFAQWAFLIILIAVAAFALRYRLIYTPHFFLFVPALVTGLLIQLPFMLVRKHAGDFKRRTPS